MRILNNRLRKPKGQSRMDNRETQATLGTIHKARDKQNNKPTTQRTKKVHGPQL